MTRSASAIMHAIADSPSQEGCAERFWVKVDKNGPTPSHAPRLGQCWIWLARKDKDGYGTFWLPPKYERAHRVSYLFAFGEFDRSLFVCHHCDTPSCVNPSHLFLGTTQDNTRDMVEKGRAPSGERHHWVKYPDRIPRGDRTGARKHPERRPRGMRHGAHTKPESRRVGRLNGRATVTDDVVIAMRRAAARGASVRAISAEFDIPYQTAYCIVRGTTWKHLPMVSQ